MSDTFRIGKDGLKVTFPSSRYTYKENNSGRIVARKL